MLNTLLESSAPRQRRCWSSFISISVHTAIIAGAVVATASARTERPVPTAVPDSSIIYIDPGEIPRPDQASGPGRREGYHRRSGTAETPRVPREPVIVWNGRTGPVPEVDLDPGKLIGDPLGTHRDRACFGGCRAGVAPDSSDTGPRTAATVERIAVLLTKPQPRYPEALRGAGIGGRVFAQFVVDTVGRVEPSSIVIREATHDLFANAVRAILPSLRFRAAEAGGHKVRMLVELPFEFRLDQ
jgi:periplasmic protein TonB